MRTFLANLWDRLRTSLWFVPSLMAGAAAVLAVALVRAEGWLTENWLERNRWLASGDPEAARQILATIAGSVITVTGVTFSVTIVALSLASQQFGPRLLRNFMRDRGNQVVLGTFIGTFIYSMLVLRVVHESDTGVRVPYLAVTVAVALAVVSMAVLIYFIHHVVTSIQADTIVFRVSREGLRTIGEMFRERRENAQRPNNERTVEAVQTSPSDGALNIHAAKSGYVYAFDLPGLLEIARSHDLVIHLVVRPGKFVLIGTTIVKVEGLTAQHSDAREGIEQPIRRAILIGSTRTAEQDVEYSIAQLVEVAVRSLSASLNDPFTAMSCLDRLGELVVEIGCRRLSKKEQRWCDGSLRLVIDRPDFEGIVNLAFNQIRQHTRDKPAVNIRMIEVIAMVLDRLQPHADRDEPLLNQAKMAANISEADVPEEADRRAIEEQYRNVLSRFAESERPPEMARRRAVE